MSAAITTSANDEQFRQCSFMFASSLRALLPCLVAGKTGGNAQTMGPLTGLKVIDLTHVMAGPTCTLMLADMGADVIKVEKTPQGDDSRHMIPPKIGDQAAAFLMMNRNKRGIVIDLKSAVGRKVLRRLVESADVLVENFAPGVMER